MADRYTSAASRGTRVRPGRLAFSCPIATMAAPTATAQAIESRYAWMRLVVSLLLMTIGGSGMYSVTVVLPRIQADFGVARADASLPYTLTMIGFGLGGVMMGRLAD